ncbi:hypothetical protein NDU88_004395 [Pleurodeles waltl]|uniref:Uncharacterized protein n=1 Tax=Pleurodeles waltl TaxID=8319 RepID=A0AAV7VGY5_PLEWA|nr:hypothetical protein NDU88_004395 [Pleurodeles waltl]
MVVGPTDECPRGTLEGAPCLCKHVRPEAESTCGGERGVKEDADSVEEDAGEAKEDTAFVEEDAVGAKGDAAKVEEDAARRGSRKEDRGLEKETPEVPEGIRATTKEGEIHGDEGTLRSIGEVAWYRLGWLPLTELCEGTVGRPTAFSNKRPL